jgi:peroxisomal 2,4-dienoyl-CoA reductase
MATSSSPFRPDCLHGKVALVTGGGSGICFEIARQLLLHGAAGALICGRRAAFLRRAAHSLQQETGARVEYCVCDVRDAQQCINAVAQVQREFGALDIVVNGAAGNFLAPASDLSPKGFATVMAIDAMGTFNMSRAAYDALCQSTRNNGDEAIIINISATLQYGATWWQAHASAAKAAVDSLTRSLALEWGPDQIRVVGIAPGPIANTPGTTKLAPDNHLSNRINTNIPLGRMGETYEIGLAAVFLCTAKYVTGSVLVVDGGEWLYRDPLVPKSMVAELSRKVEAKSRAQAPQSKL